VFLGNGLTAIVAGFLGNYLVDGLGLGRVAPFDAAALFMLIGGAMIMMTWTENYGAALRGWAAGWGARAWAGGAAAVPRMPCWRLPRPPSPWPAARHGAAHAPLNSQRLGAAGDQSHQGNMTDQFTRAAQALIAGAAGGAVRACACACACACICGSASIRPPRQVQQAADVSCPGCLALALPSLSVSLCWRGTR
jgi:hypothetical protein